MPSRRIRRRRIENIFKQRSEAGVRRNSSGNGRPPLQPVSGASCGDNRLIALLRSSIRSSWRPWRSHGCTLRQRSPRPAGGFAALAMLNRHQLRAQLPKSARTGKPSSEPFLHVAPVLNNARERAGDRLSPIRGAWNDPVGPGADRNRRLRSGILHVVEEPSRRRQLHSVSPPTCCGASRRRLPCHQFGNHRGGGHLARTARRRCG